MIRTKKNNQKMAVLVAGGTGGHIYAALSLGKKFSDLGLKIQYFTGKRPLDYKLFVNQNVIHLNSYPLGYKNPFKILRSLCLNFLSFIWLFFYFIKNRPAFILGAGGYVCGPACLAGYFLFVPIYILEQNSVMGKTNKILSFFSTKIFTHFAETQGIKMSKKVMVTGNPIRDDFHQTVHSFEFPDRKGDINLLVFGGSLGAKSINQLIYQFIEKPNTMVINIVHQTGINKSAEIIKKSEIGSYQQYEYLGEIEKYYAWCDIILCRAGASTIAELREVGKPAILVPYPQATGNHQWRNAQQLKKEVSFSVYIHNIEQLNRSSGELLAKILAKESKNLYQRPLEDKKVNHIPSSSERIANEIIGHV